MQIHQLSSDAESDLLALKEGDPVCCVYDTSRGTEYATQSCGSPSKGRANSCCKEKYGNIVSRQSIEVKTAFRFPVTTPTSLFDAGFGMPRPHSLGKNHPVVGGMSDAFSSTFKLAHVWIKNGDVETGMGPKDWSQSKKVDLPTRKERLQQLFDATRLDKPIIVEWKDHTGYSEIEGSECHQLYFCNPAVVKEELQRGKSLGYYTVLNQCHSATVEVLRKAGCYNHCVKFSSTTGLCKDRVFPELSMFKLGEE